jgi:hypothetical protein
MQKADDEIRVNTVGCRCVLDLGNGRSPVFVAGGEKRVVVEEGEFSKATLVNAIVRLADGTEYNAVLELDEFSSGEHYATYVWAKTGDFLNLHTKEDQEKLGKTRDEIFPYNYNYSPVQLDCHDHHIGADGWSL